MVKLRQAGYCNLKLFLIYLVVNGHWIENRVGNPLLLEQYQVIYLVHMPLFAFLSGLFTKSTRGCQGQLKKLVPIYIAAQGVYVLTGGAQVFTPFWHLWYLLSCCFWTGLAWVCQRFGKGRWRITVLVLAVLAGLIAGYVPWLNRTLSGSRTVVLFPFFWAGVICPADVDWKKYRKWGLASLAGAILLIIQFAEKIPVTFLYHAVPYSSFGNVGSRLLVYILATLLGFFLLSWMPQRRFPWTRAGADTMVIYLLHAPLVGVLREWSIPPGWLPLCSAGLLYLLYKLSQWNGPLYGIVPGERRMGQWPDQRTYTKPTPSRYTNSSSP